jgi:hypothetical protein
MGKVRKLNLGGLAWSALVVVVTGCHSFEWVSVEDRTLAEAILKTQPFEAPLTIEVESRLAKSCDLVVSEGSPRAWIALRDANAGELAPITLTDGSAGCALTPASRSASAGRMGAWKSTDSGDHWRVPVGMYVLEGTGTFDSISTDKSVIRSGSVIFPWSFHPFTNLENVILSQTTVAEVGMKGQARAELDRSSGSWKVVSLEMKALQPR